MEVSIYIKLDGYNDGDFDVRNDYYKDDDEFFNAMSRESQRNSNLAYEVSSKLGNIVNSNTAKFSFSVNKGKNTAENNYKAVALLYDENGKDETVDNLISNCFTNDIVVNIIKFNRDEMDEEFEEDLNFWTTEHNNINQYKEQLGAEKVWDSEPIRTLYVEFKNKADETKYIRYENCKLIGTNGIDECSILAEKITLIDSL